MSTSSGTLRTYGKKSGIKRKQSTGTSELSGKDSLPSTSPAKRRRVSEESSERSVSPCKSEQDAETDGDDDTLAKATVAATYGSRNRRTARESMAQKASPKSAPNLAGVFNDMSPSTTPSGTPSKLAKRMLGRSRTESSVESHPSPHDTQIDRTSSLPNLPASPPKGVEVPHLTSRLSGSAAMSKAATTRTYAGKYRSFLMAMPADTSAGNTEQVLDEDESEQRESYSVLRTRWGVDNSEDDPNPFEILSQTTSVSTTSEASPARKGKAKAIASNRPPPPVQLGSMNYLKSISELRNKGEGRRFLDEVGYLFEGLDPKGGLGLRRATMLEIITKLCSPDFTRKAIATDFFHRTWDLLLAAGVRDQEDKILGLLAVCFLALLARDPMSLAELAERPENPSSPSTSTHQDAERNNTVTSVLINNLATLKPEADLLKYGGDPSQYDACLKTSGLTKKDRTLLVSIHKVMASKADLFTESTSLSTPLLVAYILHSLPETLLSVSHLQMVVSSLRLQLSPDTSTSLSSKLASQWPDIAETLPYESIYYHLKLIDTYLTRERTLSSSSTRDLWMAEDLVSLGVCLEHSRRQSEDDEEDSKPETCLLLVFRMLVSLTHGNEEWGRRVLACNFTLGFLLRCIHRAGSGLHPSLPTSQEDRSSPLTPDSDDTVEPKHSKQPESNALDVLCLALGLLTNLVQVVEEIKNSIRDIHLNHSCTLEKSTCLTRCSCSPSLSGVELLASLYAQLYGAITQHQSDDKHSNTEAEAESSFLRGHLAVLFGLLMLDNPDNQSAVLTALPSISPNSTIAKSMSKHKPAAIAQDNRVKLARLVDQAHDFVVFYTVISRKFGGDGEVDREKESQLAKEVVQFLENLRDQS